MLKILPRKVCYAIAGMTARICFVFQKDDRKGLKENLRVVLGDDVSEEELNRHAVNVFRNFAKYLVDFFKFPKFTEEYINRYVEIEGREYLDKYMSEGKSVIMTGLHLGNWELGGAVIGALGYPISAITLEHDDVRINNYFVHRRLMNDLKGIPLGIQIKGCFKVLKNNEILAVMGDKDYTDSGTYVDFFGKKAVMPRGPAAFALKTGAPLMVTVLIRKPDDTYKLIMSKPVEYEITGDREKDLNIIMEKYIGIFEKCIRENPDQWYVFRKIWDQG